MELKEWVVLSYTLPREPSRSRVSVWRRLKKIGAINLQQSIWLLPYSEKNLELFNDIKENIFKENGEALVMVTQADAQNKEFIIKKFNDARDEEYKELIEQCEDFFAEIDKEIKRENFSFAEIEENEEELNKLKEWYEKIKDRDVFFAPLRDEAIGLIKKCEEDLEKFCDKVYEFTEKF